MKINSIFIEGFGKLHNFRMSFDEGINLIYGGNETGKSTVMAFIKMMFYGKAINEKSSDIAKNNRRKYVPWDGNKMGGELEFSCGGRRYRIQKTFKKTARTDEVFVFDCDTGEEIILGRDEEIGEHFLGIDVSSFEKSVFINNFGTFIEDGKDSENLAVKLSNLMTTMDENVSASDVIKNLENAMFGLKSKRGDKGEIIDLTYELSELANKIRDAEECVNKGGIIQKKIEAVREQIRYCDLQKDVLGINDMVIENTAKQEHVKQLLDRMDSLSEEYNILCREKNGPGFEHFSFDRIPEVLARADELSGEITVAKKIKSECEKELNATDKDNLKKGAVHAYFAGMIISVVFALVLLYFGVTKNAALFAPGALFLGAGACQAYKIVTKSRKQMELVRRNDRASQSYEAAKQKLDNLVREYEEYTQNVNPDKLRAKYQKIRDGETALSAKAAMLNIDYGDIMFALPEKSRLLEEELRLLQEKKVILDKKKADIQNIIDKMECEHICCMSVKKYDERIAEYNAEIFELAKQLSNKKDDPVVLKRRYEFLSEKLREKQKKYRLLELAKKNLCETMDEINRDFCPALSRKTAKIFHRLTGGEYSDAMVDKEYNVQVKKDNSIYHEWKYLSSGTGDQAYLALRLALADLLSDEEKMPLMMDDVLLRFDKKRTGYALEYLSEYAKTSQLIIFTCKKDWLEEAGYSNFLSME